MARRLILERDERITEYTAGKLYYTDRDGRPCFICDTVERLWQNNEPNVSCIPYGWYQIEPWVRPNGDNVWIITGNGCCIAPQNLDPSNGVTRWGILIHAANWPHELEGCIAPGEAVPGGVSDSRHAMRLIRAAMNPHFSTHATAQIEIRPAVLGDR